jgi:hypothetical protein
MLKAAEAKYDKCVAEMNDQMADMQVKHFEDLEAMRRAH